MGKRNAESKSGLRLNPEDPLSGVEYLDLNLISDFHDRNAETTIGLREVKSGFAKRNAS